MPQGLALNRQNWRHLENQIRKRGPATIITGAIYNNCGNVKIEAPCHLDKIAFHADGAVTVTFTRNSSSRDPE